MTLATQGDPYKLHGFSMRFVHTNEFQEVERNERSQAIHTEWKEWTSKARSSHKKVLHGIVRTNEQERAIVKRYELIKYK